MPWSKGGDKFRRIRLMILSRVLLAPFVIVMLVFGTLVYYLSTNLRSQASAEMVMIVDGHRRLISQFLNDQKSAIEFAAYSQDFSEITAPNHVAGLLGRLQERYPAMLDLGVFDGNGNHVAYAGPYDLTGKNYSKAAWFGEVKNKPFYISDVFLGYRNIPHFIIAVRRIEKGRAWYMRATIDSQYFNNLVESIRMGRTGEAYLVNGNGLFQTKRRSGGALMKEDPDFALFKADRENVVTFTEDSPAGGRYLYATGLLAETGWILVARQEAGDAYAPLTHAVLICLAMIAGGGAVVVLTAYVLASSLANQLTMAEMEKREMSGKLIVAGKMAEIGEMTSGMAHEINNPLQVMISECAMLNEVMSDADAANRPLDQQEMEIMKDCVNQVGVQITRCRNITQGLLKFARKSKAAITDVDVKALVGEVVRMVEHQATVQGISILNDSAKDVPVIKSDSSQLQQVFLNLINNAIYAVKDSDPGEVRISVSEAETGVAVSIADNGCGIEPENLEKIFLPFYTTKPVGQGTGLGLSTCYGIVERLGGRISVSSEVNTGTVFTVQLPMSAAHEIAGIKHGNNA